MSCARRTDGLESAARYLHQAVLASCEQRGIEPDVDRLAAVTREASVDTTTLEILLSSPDWTRGLTGPSRRNFWYWTWAAFEVITALQKCTYTGSSIPPVRRG